MDELRQSFASLKARKVNYYNTPLVLKIEAFYRQLIAHSSTETHLILTEPVVLVFPTMRTPKIREPRSEILNPGAANFFWGSAKLFEIVWQKSVPVSFCFRHSTLNEYEKRTSCSGVCQPDTDFCSKYSVFMSLHVSYLALLNVEEGDESTAPNAIPTAKPSGILCTVIAIMSNNIRFQLHAFTSLSHSISVYSGGGCSYINMYIYLPGIKILSTSISYNDMNKSDKYTKNAPNTKPTSAGTILSSEIKLEPTAVKPHVNKVPNSVCTTGLKFCNMMDTSKFWTGRLRTF
ncbi:hypothetical protein AGLY_011820 [Aphis glycines]|uniref:Uncharacterized protein n=1 Tax=Aphis glycines TaxID=307491 RepID=A0A6G0TDF3_APHGL|nr:hypothetical protein AGLY_011820 [Aphis glycines]